MIVVRRKWLNTADSQNGNANVSHPTISKPLTQILQGFIVLLSLKYRTNDYAWQQKSSSSLSTSIA